MRAPPFCKIVLLCLAAVLANNAFAQATCTLTCPANATLSNEANQCGAVVTYPAPTIGVGDNCGTITCTPPSGAFYPVGATTVTCTAAAGPTCTFTVTVNDTEPPFVAVPANQFLALGENQTSAVVNYPAPTPADNCPGATLVATPPSGSTFSAGETIVTVTATDASGNIATGTFLVILRSFISVPTLSEAALVLLALMLMGIVALRQYRSR
jgi:hypothetical protein